MASIIPQAAAIPFRTSHDTLEILLIRWIEEKDQWGVPKGLIDPGNSARETAEIECMEEAGISGDLLEPVVGEFTYSKYHGTCSVQVFALRVRTEHAHYEEAGFRERKWFQVDDAIEHVARKPLKAIIRNVAQILSSRPG